MRLANITGGTERTVHMPLLVESKVDSNVQANLQQAALNYVETSIYNYHPQKFPKHWHCLSEYEILELLCQLPNKTPNGLILPKKHTYLSYNVLHKALVEVVKSLHIPSHIQLIHNPVNIRVVSGNSNQQVDGRPRASTKVHSDIWAGEMSNTIMIFLPIMGDIRLTGIDFYEPPARFCPEYVRPLDDYEQGSNLLEESIKYDAQMKNGAVYFSDTFLLHQTMKKGGGPRLSIDFRFICDKVETDLEFQTSRHENYIPFDEWAEYGTTKILVNLGDPQPSMDNSGNAYADKYTSLEVK